MADQALFTKYSQRENLTDRLRGILDDYPPGLGPWKEFLQNADDANASAFSICLDFTDHRRAISEESNGGGAVESLDPEGLFSPELAAWQGPSLCIFNDAQFTEGDFANLTRLGTSEKAKNAAKIGRFGIGFNTAYHFTDVVSFASGTSLVMLDPHETHLPNGDAGLRCSLLDERVQGFSKQVGPLSDVAEALGLPSLKAVTEAAPFPGTLFRLPLRDEKTVSASSLSARAYTAAGLLPSLEDFARVAPELLLFLQHVESVSLFVRGGPGGGGGGIERVFSVAAIGLTDKVREERRLLSSFVALAKKNKKESVQEEEAEEGDAEGKKDSAAEGVLAAAAAGGDEEQQQQPQEKDEVKAKDASFTLRFECGGSWIDASSGGGGDGGADEKKVRRRCGCWRRLVLLNDGSCVYFIHAIVLAAVAAAGTTKALVVADQLPRVRGRRGGGGGRVSRRLVRRRGSPRRRQSVRPGAGRCPGPGRPGLLLPAASPADGPPRARQRLVCPDQEPAGPVARRGRCRGHGRGGRDRRRRGWR